MQLVSGELQQALREGNSDGRSRRSGSRPGIRFRRSRTARCRSGCRFRLRLPPRSGRASPAPGSRAAASFISRAPQTAAKRRESAANAPIRRQASGYQHPPAGSHLRSRVLHAAAAPGRPCDHEPRRKPGRQPGDDRPAPSRGRHRQTDRRAVRELAHGRVSRRSRQLLLQPVPGLVTHRDETHADPRAHVPRRAPLGRPGGAGGALGSSSSGRSGRHGIGCRLDGVPLASRVRRRHLSDLLPRRPYRPPSRARLRAARRRPRRQPQALRASRPDIGAGRSPVAVPVPARLAPRADG